MHIAEQHGEIGLADAFEDNAVPSYIWDFDVQGKPEWLYVTALDDWCVFPYVVLRSETGLRLKQSAPSEPLLKASLRQSHKLSFSDLLRLCKMLDLAGDSYSDRAALIAVLARFAGEGDTAYFDQVSNG